ncbi:NFX1-type zinc finger-containing protein 1-like [Physella acuta]|uniref:NFX1-type zinc finger-containing protein 1-like n=1 Tax=Physella acuta TaxID=109671 RepID=UPI0027DC12EA|nr:NFX1-type zinc finger-containing protein 1-like [Physella acuta]XP_059147743.1 NFX1-type zinc finger-containing protein 1-like [Physella acuta]
MMSDSSSFDSDSETEESIVSQATSRKHQFLEDVDDVSLPIVSPQEDTYTKPKHQAFNKAHPSPIRPSSINHTDVENGGPYQQKNSHIKYEGNRKFNRPLNVSHNYQSKERNSENGYEFQPQQSRREIQHSASSRRENETRKIGYPTLSNFRMKESQNYNENQTFRFSKNEHEFSTSSRQHNQHRVNESKSHVGYKKLEEWANSSNATVLVFQMSLDVDGLFHLLQQRKLNFDWMLHLVSALRKILMAQSQKSSLKYFFSRICESNFLNPHLCSFVRELKMRRPPDIYSIFQKMIDIIEYFIHNLDKFNAKCNEFLQVIMDIGQQLNLLTENDGNLGKVQKLIQITTVGRIERNQVVYHRAVSQRQKRDKAVPIPDDETPPDDFTNIAIFPDTEEINTSVEPFLRANKTKGPYRDLQHYLDIHARLMKEDYVAPIREGLKEFRDAQENNRKPKENELRFYYDVKLTKINCESEGITHFVTFNNSQLTNVDWEFSKRLMFGSLLVFSKDNFETLIFATVANRSVTMLERGIIQVVFQNHLEDVFTSSSENDTFIMAETTAYFESYRHVLEGLKEMISIPLEKYIIFCKHEISPPDYLNEITAYNIESIMKETYDEFPVSVLDDDDWPESNETNLNDSQLEALKLALTKELAIIQGPPGTGKTYIGLKIMNILLQNETSVGCEGPILVVCYTNHALDQFMEGILDFCSDGIVRVGGRSQSEKLEKFNLQELRKNPVIDNKIKKSIRVNLDRCNKEVGTISKVVNKLWQESIRLETTILKVDDLADEISDVHSNSLNDPSRTKGINSQVMEIWLKASNANMENHLLKVSKRHLCGVIAKGTEHQSDTVCKDYVRIVFQDRVQIYHFWLNKYKEILENKVNLLLSNDPENFQELDPLLQLSEEANRDILPDDVLTPYMSDKVYELVKKAVSQENKKVECENNYLRLWLLGSFQAADKILDAIELLTTVKKDTNQAGRNKKAFVETEAAKHAKRWVIEDTDESASENETEDDSENSDGGGEKLRTDLKELEQRYEQLKTKEIKLLERAKMFGIDLSETADEAGEDDWQTVNNMSYAKVFHLYNRTVAFTEEEVSEITNVWNLTLGDRYKLYKYWVSEKKRKLTDNLISVTKEYKDILQRKKEVSQLKNIEILKKAKVIGMTTTGAAKHRAVLQDVGCPIIIVEEAAEVLEAHIVTTLNNRCKHLILIGDHQQLRPSPTVHKLAVDYELEISLFERLVKNRVPRVTLTEQHRMRPEISRFIRHIYPHLEDYDSVHSYENIIGVKSNIFFLQHSIEESVVEDSTSKSNVHEAKFVTALCKYFLQQGYQGRQITILAAYSGQVTCIRNHMEPEENLYEFVRVTSIDNYQGEENDIVLVSLVRSNQENEVGFLKTDNRVCVALSRAKKGMFVIGNLQLLATKSWLWRNILETAQDKHVTGVYMKLVCVNHSHHETVVINGEDFQKEVPEGGCNKKCEARLHCGHTCTRMCHASDRFHEETRCEQPCSKTCPKGHKCQKLCYEPCGSCEVRVLKTMPFCGHDDMVPCSKEVEDVDCSQNCGQKMACGHICRGQCGKCSADAQHHPCMEKVDKKWSPCQHSMSVECHTDITVDPCPEKCPEKLECGHKCKGTCGGCLSGRVHKSCGEKCNKILPCGHLCTGPCGGQCVPCSSRCLTACRHGPCSKTTCGEKCDTCIENCAMICQHRHCNMRCVDECLEPLCTKRCNKLIISCKHKCVSLCGEPCVCYDCEKDKFTLIDSSNKKKHQLVIAHDKRERAKKFEVDQDTILMKIPKCGHIFTLKQLDKWVEDFEPDTTHYIRCPNCTVPIQMIARYEPKNKQRAERRENLKDMVITESSISDEKVEKIILSKQFINNFCSVDEGEFLTRKPKEIDFNHALTLTLQIKFAYALLKIFEIHQNFNENEFNIKKWKLIINSMQRNVTDQFYREMTLELHRLLLLEQIYILNGFLDDINCKPPEELRKQVRNVLKEKPKLTSNDRQIHQSLADSLYQLFDHLEPDDHWLNKTMELKQYSKLVTQVLDIPMSEDLCDFLH